MTARKLKKLTENAGLQITNTVASSEGHPMDRTMTYWLERISPEDIVRLWIALRASVRDVKPRITSGQWVSGTMSEGALPVDVTTCTTHSGFVLVFTDAITSRSAGGGKP